MELIDTLWNVNTEDDAKAVEAASELIDTLWNVNVATIIIDTNDATN